MQLEVRTRTSECNRVRWLRQRARRPDTFLNSTDTSNVCTCLLSTSTGLLHLLIYNHTFIFSGQSPGRPECFSSQDVSVRVRAGLTAGPTSVVRADRAETSDHSCCSSTASARNSPVANLKVTFAPEPAAVCTLL